MPAFKDLTGMTFGDLRVIKLVRQVPSTTQKQGSVWRIHCQRCGRYEDIRQLWIPYCQSNANRRSARYSCTVCFRGACEVCGNEILNDNFIGVCSPQCHHERQKLNYRNHYYRQVDADSDFNKKNYLRKKSDPKQLGKMREYWRIRSQKRRENPQFLVAEKKRLTDFYQAHKSEIQLKRKAKFDALSELEKAQIRKRNRENGQNWYHRNHDLITYKRKIARDAMTEAQREARREKMREYYYDSKRKSALSQLINIGEQLNAIDHHRY